MKKITVLLADDHTVVREGLRALLELDGGFDVIGEADDGLQAVELSLSLRPDVVVMDIAMPKLNGLEAARRILQHTASTPKILMLSAHADAAYIEQVTTMGVMGYLVKQTSVHVLAKAIREIYNGNVFYNPSVPNFRFARKDKPNRFAGWNPRGSIHLTSREREIVQLVAEGESNKEVASNLSISIKTVEKHRHSAMYKLDIHDTAGLTRYAISAGIIESSIQNTVNQ